MNNNNFYEKIEVWKRMENEIGIYICYKDLETDLYYVKTMHIVNKKLDDKKLKFQVNLNYELFLESNPSEGSIGYSSLLDAIDSFNKSLKDIADS